MLVPGAEVAAYGVGLPQHTGLIDDHRYLCVGVVPEKLRAVGRGETAAPILAFVGKAQLLTGPQDLPDVDRRGFSQNFQCVFHCATPLAYVRFRKLTVFQPQRALSGMRNTFKTS